MTPKFEHIIVLMLENRSFDHLFGFLNHSKKYNGLKGTESNPKSITDSTPISVYKSDKTFISPDPGHSHDEIMTQLDLGLGHTNDGFVHSFTLKKALKGGTSEPKEIMSALDPTTPQQCGFIMSELAKRFVLCDNWFSSVPGETWPNRNFAVAATSNGEVNIKTKFYSNKTIFEELAKNGRTWQIYQDGPAQLWAFYKLWFLKNGGFRSFSKFKEDVKNDKLNNFVFIEPKHFPLFGPTNNMHPGNNSQDSDTDFKSAENLIAFIYNTLHTNKKVFDKSLLVITFDEHGGFYDHVPPPTCTPPGDKTADNGFNFDRYGVRVPAIIISPYVKKSYIDSTLYDHTSIIKSVFQNFDIPSHLTNRDKNANSFLDNVLVSRKKTNIKDIDEHEITVATRSLEVQPENHPYNDFQEDLNELVNNMNEVMDDSEAKVAAKIKALDTQTRSLEKTVHQKVNLKAFEDKFLERYSKKK
ncbi:MAG: alkaline phosphatase family protein [Saprospiraceae bacterium]